MWLISAVVDCSSSSNGAKTSVIVKERGLVVFVGVGWGNICGPLPLVRHYSLAGTGGAGHRPILIFVCFYCVCFVSDPEFKSPFSRLRRMRRVSLTLPHRTESSVLFPKSLYCGW